MRSWSVHLTPIADVGNSAQSDGVLLGYPVGATRLSTGGIVVADRILSAVHFSDREGRLIRSVGRQGEGPGEFGRIAWLGRCGGDSVHVWDIGLKRITVLDGVGRLIRTYRLPADPPPTFVACSSTGVFALLAIGSDQATQYNPRTGEGPHMRGPFRLADRRGVVVQTLGDVAVGEGRPLGKETRFALSANRLFVGTNDSAFVDVYTFDGRQVSARSLQLPPRAPSRANYEWAIETRVMQVSSADMRESGRQMLRGIPMPAVRPPYAGLFADPAGNLWAQVSMPGDGETWLRGLSPEGTIVADIRFPGDLTVFEVGRDYVLGAYEAETGEPHVAMYRLRNAQ